MTALLSIIVVVWHSLPAIGQSVVILSPRLLCCELGLEEKSIVSLYDIGSSPLEQT